MPQLEWTPEERLALISILTTMNIEHSIMKRRINQICCATNYSLNDNPLFVMGSIDIDEVIRWTKEIKENHKL